MTRITNADQVLLLLRAHLERAQRGKRAGTERRSTRAGAMSRVRELANTEGLSEAEVGRALIAGILTEEFGAELAVEPRFQAMIDDVRRIIERDDSGKALLKRAIAQIGASD
jgi:hypothetical protein